MGSLCICPLGGTWQWSAGASGYRNWVLTEMGNDGDCEDSSEFHLKWCNHGHVSTRHRPCVRLKHVVYSNFLLCSFVGSRRCRLMMLRDNMEAAVAAVVSLHPSPEAGVSG